MGLYKSTMSRAFFIFPICAVFLSGCASKGPLGPTNDLSTLTSLTRDSEDTGAQISAIRFGALRDTALSLGARGGLASRAEELNKLLETKSRALERIFNFNALMLENNVLPPVLTEARHTLNMADENSLRIADRTFEIERQARFTTAAPTWREYLWLEYPQPDLPDRALLPKNEDEITLWRKYVRQGWEAGRAQADNIYTENLGRLKRDFEGMIRYRVLLAQNMVTAPFVARTELGITGGGKELSINDRVLKITAHPSLQSKSSEWHTEITVND